MTVEFWFLIGAALVFWMQAGFAMCETGFTRAKSAGNIIMKNLMDFCIGTVVFSLLGYSLMMGEDTLFGLIGKPNLDLFLHFKEFIASPADGSFTGASTFVFNLVFCATTATIVSGAMAERTKPEYYRGVEIETNLMPKVQVDIVISKVPVRDVIETAKKVLYTGHIGDGKIFVYDVENVVRIRTGEEGYDALQDDE